MQSLAEALANATPSKSKRGGNPCMTCAWMNSLNPDDRQAFEKAVLSGAWLVVDLYRLATDFGLVVGESGFNRHVKNHQASTK